MLKIKVDDKKYIYILADHAVGLSTFTIMAGLGGSMGYAMGAIDWGWLGDYLLELLHRNLRLTQTAHTPCYFYTKGFFTTI